MTSLSSTRELWRLTRDHWRATVASCPESHPFSQALQDVTFNSMLLLDCAHLRRPSEAVDLSGNSVTEQGLLRLTEARAATERGKRGQRRARPEPWGLGQTSG